MKNALNNQVGMLGDMFLWLVANLKQGIIYFIKQALPPNISAGSVPTSCQQEKHMTFGTHRVYSIFNRSMFELAFIKIKAVVS